MTPMFDKVKEFLDKNDVYGSDKTVNISFKVAYEPQTLPKAIRNCIKIFDLVEEIGLYIDSGALTFQ